MFTLRVCRGQCATDAAALQYLPMQCAVLLWRGTYSPSHLMAFHFWLSERTWVFICQELSQGRTFQKPPLEAPPRGISVSVWTGNIIRAHMFIKYGSGIWAAVTAISCHDAEYLSSELMLLPDLETVVVSGGVAVWWRPAGNPRPWTTSFTEN